MRNDRTAPGATVHILTIVSYEIALFGNIICQYRFYFAHTDLRNWIIYPLTKQHIYKIRVAQTAMEIAMLGLHLVDHGPNMEIRPFTKFEDVGTRIVKLKWRWAGHLAMQDTNKKGYMDQGSFLEADDDLSQATNPMPDDIVRLIET